VTEPIPAIVIEAPCAAWTLACPNAAALARAAAGIALARVAKDRGLSPGAAIEIGISLVDDAAQRQLNRDWRGIDAATNVLAFPAWDPGAAIPPNAPLLLGDVVLAFDTVMREAAEQGRPLADHLSHLVVHGVLHLLGYDHLAEADATAMETLETAILASLGVPDPYRRAI
jgi:probable rRNA maturation factor